MEWILLELPQPAVFKVNRDGDRFSAYLWDFSRLLVEDLTADEVLTRAKDRNRSFEYDVDSLMDIFRNSPKEATFSDDGHQLKLKYYVEKIPFHFYWDLKEENEQKDISTVVAIPLLLALKQTRDRETELLKIIARKDAELQDYKNSDVSLSNKFLGTKPLDVDNFCRSTPWDCITGEDNVEKLSSVIPGISESGYIPAESSMTTTEHEESALVTKITSKATKRKILNKIQSDKIGAKPVEFKYLQDSQEIDRTDDELEAPPAKIPTVSSGQRPGRSQSIKSTRKLGDVL